jgi:hypothetical protein
MCSVLMRAHNQSYVCLCNGVSISNNFIFMNPNSFYDNPILFMIHCRPTFCCEGILGGIRDVRLRSLIKFFQRYYTSSRKYLTCTLLYQTQLTSIMLKMVSGSGNFFVKIGCSVRST